jgi:Cytochrome C oxidase, cbb3-type, subunit III
LKVEFPHWEDRVNRQGVARWTGWVFALAGVVIGVGVFNVAPRAQTAPAPEDVAAGFRIYRQKADCQACHGWAADGRKMESQMPDGANLRATKLDRAKLVQAIKCGIPGKSMPAFDKFAYSDGRCYGMKQADLQKLGTTMPDPAATLQAREIEQVADFLFAKVVGKGPMNHAACVEFWGSDVDVCKEFPN